MAPVTATIKLHRPALVLKCSRSKRRLLWKMASPTPAWPMRVKRSGAVSHLDFKSAMQLSRRHST